MIWADDVLKGLDPVSRAVLSKLAGVSDDHDCAWMTVATLAKRIGVSERTVQGRMRLLEDRWKLLTATGRMHRFGTRSVPIYELQVDHAAVAEVVAGRRARREISAQIRAGGPSSMGAVVCTHADQVADAICTPMGAAVCTPKEDNREQVEANASTERARESASADLEAEFQAFMDAYPETGRKRTSWAGARNAFAQAARQVPRPSVLTECVKAYAADPILLASKHGAVNAVEFLAGERWRSFMPKSAEPQALPATSAASGWDGPAEVWAAVCADKKLGEGWAASWLAPCVIEAGVLHPRTGIAADRLRQEVGGLLAHYGLQIGEARKPGSLGGADGH